MFDEVGFGEYLDDVNNYMPHMGANPPAPAAPAQPGVLAKFGEGLLTQGLQIGTEAAKKELKIGDYKKQPGANAPSPINVNVPPLLSKKTLGIIGGVALVGLLAFFLMRRRQMQA